MLFRSIHKEHVSSDLLFPSGSNFLALFLLVKKNSFEVWHVSVQYQVTEQLEEVHSLLDKTIKGISAENILFCCLLSLFKKFCVAYIEDINLFFL